MKTIKRIAQILAGLLCGVGCLELGIRTISPHAGSSFLFQAPENAPNGMYVRDKKLIYKPNPGFSAQSVSPGYSVPIRINSLSLRGGELAEKSNERWLVMGDSFGFSAQVSEEDHFIGQLNQTGLIEFLNGGADGYGTWQALLRYYWLEWILLDYGKRGYKFAIRSVLWVFLVVKREGLAHRCGTALRENDRAVWW